MNVLNHFKATTIDECLLLLESSSNPTVIHGGTDVVVKLNEEWISDVTLIDISSIASLKKIEISESKVTIGAGCTFTEILERRDDFPERVFGFIDALDSIGSPQIRNAGTVGGNICNGSPAADSIPVLIALNAELLIVSKNSTRTVLLKDFFLGKGQVDLKESELLTEITFVLPENDYQLLFYKFSPRNALSITLGSIATLSKIKKGVIEDIIIASGGFSAFCQREPEMEQLFVSKALNELNNEWEQADTLVQNRIKMFDDEFQIMKHITLSAALKHTIKECE